ncbi:MAG: MBL fold metallo-hydrolase [Actinocatenispora sp.]
MSGDVVGIGERLALVGGGGFGLSDALDGHVYLLRTGAGRGVLVDTGAGRDTGRILANVAAAGVTAVDAVLVTHAHADHAGGAAEIAELTGAPVYGSAAELDLLARGDRTALGIDAAVRTGTYPADYTYRPCAAGVPVTDRQQLSFDGLSVTALVVPGHTAGSVVWLAGWDGYVAALTGDTVFAGGLVSVLNLDGSDAGAYRRHLPALAEQPIDGLFPGHGEVKVRGGGDDVRRAVDLLGASVIPNRAVFTGGRR